MKLIVTGASGFVATEVLRQALLRDDITDIVAMARQPVSAPSGITAEQGEKLDSVVVEDYGTYSEAVKKKFENADAVIWTVAITPSKARSLPVDEVKKVCQDWTNAGFQAILEANRNAGRKVKFIYVSGTAASDPAHRHEKDSQAWMPAHMRDYARMRGETATKLFAMAKENEKNIEICIAKPGFITGGQRGLTRRVFGSALWVTGLVETIDVKEVAAALLEGAVHGFEGFHGVLTNSELMDRARTRTQS